MGKNFVAKAAVGGSVVGTAIVAAVSPDLLESAVKYLSDAGQTQFAKDMMIFSLAAFIHSGRLKKEIKSNFALLTTSINQVADAFREDLKAHGERLENLANRVAALEGSKKPALDEATPPVEELVGTTNSTKEN